MEFETPRPEGRRLARLHAGIVAVICGATLTHATGVARADDFSWSAATPFGGQIFAVACPSTSRCTAVGGDGLQQSKQVTFDPSSPAGASPTVIDPQRTEYVGLACPSAGQCTAVQGGEEVTFDASSPGTPTRVTFDSNTEFAAMDAVACPSTTQCTTVGDAGQVDDANGNPVVIKGQEETFNPASPGSPAPTTPLDPGHTLTGVACLSVSECVAVGDGGQEMTFDPSSPATASVSTIGGGVGLGAVVCPSTSQCSALAGVGQEVTFDPASPGAASPVTIDPGLVQTSNSSNFLTGMACPSTTECVAVDTMGRAVKGDPTSSAAWTVEQVATVDAVSGAGELSSIACPSTTQCVLADFAGNVFAGTIAGSATLPPTVPVTGIGAPPTPRAGTSPPMVTGTVVTGASVGCSSLWSGSPPLSFAYQWLRDGTAIPGATGSTYAIVAADAGHGLSCRVTATNAAGSATSVSASVDVPSPRGHGVGVAGNG